MLIFFYKNDGRRLRQIITGLLKSGTATKIRRENYIQSYTRETNKIQKIDEKMVIVEFLPENQQKLESLLKNFAIEEYHVIEPNLIKNHQ